MRTTGLDLPVLSQIIKSIFRGPEFADDKEYEERGSPELSPGDADGEDDASQIQGVSESSGEGLEGGFLEPTMETWLPEVWWGLRPTVPVYNAKAAGAPTRLWGMLAGRQGGSGMEDGHAHL